MSSGCTIRGLARTLESVFHGTWNGGPLPSSFYLMLLSAIPTSAANLVSDLSEIPAGNGYSSGGNQVAVPGDFEAIVEDDVNDWAYVQLVDQTYTSTGGLIPSDGSSIFAAALTDDNATLASREVFGWLDLSGPIVISDLQDMTVLDPEIRLRTAV